MPEQAPPSMDNLITACRAARELESILAKLVKAGEIDICGTDVGGAALRDRLNNLCQALKNVGL